MKKRVMVSVLTMVIWFGMPHLIHAQSGKDAVRALQKLQSRVEVGISYRDYGPALGDAVFEVKMFLRSPEAKEKSELAHQIEMAKGHYELAGSVWNTGISLLGRGLIVRDSRGILFTMRQINEMRLMDLYPELSSVVYRERGLFGSSEYIFLNQALTVIWKRAGQELEKAIGLLE